ncbi:MAG: formate dehydrogenase accessory sulfurtransferase FdhD [Actinobacteria bacterium]|nr:formate dehydrogenase accessory sulfurtransferase FdhD [Actinomycetota bacterium]
MEVDDTGRSWGLSETYHDPRYSTVDTSLGSIDIICEHQVDVWLEGDVWLKIVCTPADLTDLIIGRLITESIIRTKEDIASLDIDEQGTCAKVMIRPGCSHYATTNVVHVSSTCCANERTAVMLPSSWDDPCPLRPVAWEPEWISHMAEYLEMKTPLYTATRSAHSALLMQDGKIICCREDIARHNAIDKVIGWAESAGIDRRSCILFTSGRVPIDMAMKVIRAGISVLASKALPTQQAVSLAKRHGMILLHISDRCGLLRFS